MENSKRERFKKIATARTNKTLNMIKLLGNCSNKAAYEYRGEEVTKIFDAINKELKNARMRFTLEESDDSGFKL